jgi:plastocyanin
VHVRSRIRSALGLAAAAAVCGCGASSYGDGPAPPPPPARTVRALPSLAFNPDTLAVSVGDTVTFVFGPVAHNVIFDPFPGTPADVPGANANTAAARVFTVPGFYTYACRIHPGMRGSVRVRARPAP